MAHLCAMKRTANLTDLQITAWHNVLGIFDTDVVNASVLEMAFSETRFPELGDLYQICRAMSFRTGRWKQPYRRSAGENDDTRPTAVEIRAVAERFGLKVP